MWCLLPLGRPYVSATEQMMLGFANCRLPAPSLNESKTIVPLAQLRYLQHVNEQNPEYFLLEMCMGRLYATVCRPHQLHGGEVLKTFKEIFQQYIKRDDSK